MSSSSGSTGTRKNNTRCPFYRGCNNGTGSYGRNDETGKKPDVKNELKLDLHGVVKGKQTKSSSKTDFAQPFLLTISQLLLLLF